MKLSERIRERRRELVLGIKARSRYDRMIDLDMNTTHQERHNLRQFEREARELEDELREANDQVWQLLDMVICDKTPAAATGVREGLEALAVLVKQREEELQDEAQ